MIDGNVMSVAVSPKTSTDHHLRIGGGSEKFEHREETLHLTPPYFSMSRSRSRSLRVTWK